MAVGFFSIKDAGEFALGLTQNSRISQVAFQFFGWVIVMRGREGIRVSLSDELTGGNGVFSA